MIDGETTAWHVDAVAEHFKSKGFEAHKMTGLRGEINALAVSKRGKIVMKFFVRGEAIRKKHLLAVVKEYAVRQKLG